MKSSLPSAGRHDVPVTRGDAPIYRGKYATCLPQAEIPCDRLKTNYKHMKSTRLKSSLNTQGNDYFNRQRFHLTNKNQKINR